MTIEELTGIIAVISFLGGIATYLFKKIVIEPLQNSIDALNGTLQDFKMSTDKELEIHDKEIDFLKERTTRHEEQLKTLIAKRDGA